MRNQASERLKDQKSRALGGLGTVADAIRGSGRQLREQDHNTVAQYVENAADQLQRFSQRLDEKEIGEIVEEVQRFGRTRPALFVGLAFGAGLLGARFLKSSADAGSYSSDYDQRAGSTPDWRRSAPAYGGTVTTGSAPSIGTARGTGPRDLA